MDPEELSDITNFDTTPDILMQVKLQIEKDLGLAGFSYSFPDGPVDLPALVPELAEKIGAMRDRASGDLMKIIYRVDLTERQYKKVSVMPGEWVENIAKAIVLREFQKVVIRKKFNS
jgi:hypothetical protein